jgi:hypothetical protein
MDASSSTNASNIRHTAMMQATTAMPSATEMPETVLKPTTREFSQKFAKNLSEWRSFVKKYKEKE